MAILFDIHGNELRHHDLQDKHRWCKDGEALERGFIATWGDQLGYALNPLKENDPFVPDLVNINTKSLADLKVQGTPFFKAGELYGIDPTYAVVFNKKDQERYSKLYPDIEIVFCVDWRAVRAIIRTKTYEVEPHMGIYKVDFQEFNELLERSKEHDYINRRFDNLGNAKASYVLDIRDHVFKRLI